MRRIAIGSLWALLLAAVAACSPGASGPSISQDELMKALRNPKTAPVILDVRSHDEFEGGHIPGALNVPHNEVGDWLRNQNLTRDKDVVVYCESGGRSATAQQVLINAGFASVRHLEGDMKAWRAKGLPCDGCVDADEDDEEEE